MAAPACSPSVLRRRNAVLPCLLAFVALAPPASATSPGRNGAIAYIGRIDGTDTLLARTGPRVRGVLTGARLADPAWSPLGRRLAVVRSSPDGQDIWIVGENGQGPRQLTTSANDETDPTWSPEADEVAFTGGPASARHIYAIGAEGHDVRQITFGAADVRQPAWSSTGRIAYVVRTTQGDDLYVVGSSGRKPRRLTHLAGNESSPSWSPDGRVLAFAHNGGIWTVSALGARPKRAVKLRGSAQTAPAWSPDGRRLVFSSGRPGHRRIYAANPNGKAARPLSSRRTDGRWPDWQPAGLDPVVMAAGDIACDPASSYFNDGLGIPRHCGELKTSDLLLRSDLWAVLPLGDTQYQDGALAKFAASYDPTWGRTKYLQRPAIGNHEYQTGAAGYFDYFNGVGAADGPAGNRALGYYSFDVGTWHIVSLNSNCAKVPGGCDIGSPQERWLSADLAAHPTKCTLAMWHSPLFSSFRGGDVQTIALWQTLYSAGADVVLVGHHHFYERFAPQTAGGDRDPAQGIRQFTVGTGGKSLDSPGARDPNSVVIGDSTFGVLKLVLHPGSYDWAFESASPDPFTDVGSYPCH